ncbi:cystathionine beta-lyase [Arenicella xantha]|uniref:Cystathionine beta-lyase n=1 Tax=Arenicella xantha TaxID=644221 RepID=A0A395JJK6_9GAMM|nr:cystathionine beta-lyase [Arenicella xantha]RBP48864.1 cystathionine beta-lyase [Arenicella xantha]
MKDDTQLVAVGRNKKYTGSAVNPRIARASTIVFDSVEEMLAAGREKDNGAEFYGRRGTATTFAFTEAMCELEQAAGCYVYPCGTSAITASLMSFLSAGDHLLVVDSVYEPTREFCDGTLARYGVETSYYDPLIIPEASIRENTKVIFIESPGSLTMEVQDIVGVVAAAKAHGITTIMDNTYATPLNFKPLAVGVDISVHSATKYLSGHSDVMLGVASANQAHWPQLQARSYELGLCASVDDIYTTLRGIRTLGVRMREQASNAQLIAEWLAEQPEVDHLRHPNFSSCPGYEYFARDMSASNGLFSVVLRQNNPAAINALVDGMRHFKIGFSWGGYESLILAASEFSARRTATAWDESKGLIRLSIGLEDPQDLIDDLNMAFVRYREVLR